MLMACKRVILREAAREYESIVAYLAHHLKSPQAALGFIDEFDRQLDLVCENPDVRALSRMPELAARGYHATLVGSYIMLYRADKDVVYVAHVFHQSQDYATLV